VIIPQTTGAFVEIANSIRSGGVIAFRTDTFYGLGADPFKREGSANNQTAKGQGRPEGDLDRNQRTGSDRPANY